MIALAAQGGHESVPALLGFLADDDRRTRAWALVALADCEPPPAPEAVVAALAPEWDAAEAPVAATRRLLAGAVAPGAIVRLGLTTTVMTALQSDDRRLRRRAAWLLGTLDDTSSVPTLIGALQDADEGVRLAAARSLGTLADERARPALEQLALCSGWRGRRRARWAISRLDADTTPTTTH